jgi:hypothetical protein
MTLATFHPHLEQEFICEKNEGIDFYSLKPRSNKKIWWRCSKGHEYPTKVCHRTRPNAKCPYCTGRKLAPERSLAVCNPELAKEFHPVKNGETTAADVFISSGKTHWWLCQVNNSHEWPATVDNRKRGTGCPYCRGKKVLLDDSFGKKFSALLEEWDFKKNQKDPFSLACQSNYEVYWTCKSKSYHCWSASVASRVNGRGCPYCSNHRLHEKDSAFYQLPQKILDQFDQSLNPSINLKNVSISLEKALVWKCNLHHEHGTWKAWLKSRIAGKNNCPKCEPHSTRISYEKSVAYLYPHLIEEWHPDNLLRPTQLKARSGRLVKWICQFRKQHIYEMRVAQRVEGRGCSKCRNAPTLPELRLFSELALWFSPLLHHKVSKEKIDIYLEDVNLAIEWDSYYFHSNRTDSDLRKTKSLLSTGIKTIRIRNSKLDKLAIEDSNLAIIETQKQDADYEVFKKIVALLLSWNILDQARAQSALSRSSFFNDLVFEELKLNRGKYIYGKPLSKSHPEVSSYWHPTKNGQFNTNEVRAFSHESYWWFCKKCKSEWCEIVVNVTTRKGICGCCSQEKAGPTYNLLIAYPLIAKELISADPSKITPHSGKRCLWKCSKCSFEWPNTVNGRTGKSTNGCPKCAGKILTLEKSVAGVGKQAIDTWDFSMNSARPEEVFLSTHTKYFFKCACGETVLKKPRNFLIRKQNRCSLCLKKK